MNTSTSYHHTRAYRVTTTIYEGPLDLLLQLIERTELDITKLALAQVTDQYLAHLRQISDRAAEEVSAFLVIAAKLLQIKSEALLPRPPTREQGEDDEDPGEALARQLRIYKRFKEIAEILAQRETANLRTYLRLAPVPKAEGSVDLTGLTLDDLVLSAQAVLSQVQKLSLGTVVAPPKITIREKIGAITRFLKTNRKGTFRQLLARKPIRLDVVVTFLAMLELIKRRLVQVQQAEIFGEIEIEPTGNWDDNETFELEFGE